MLMQIALGLGRSPLCSPTERRGRIPDLEVRRVVRRATNSCPCVHEGQENSGPLPWRNERPRDPCRTAYQTAMRSLPRPEELVRPPPISIHAGVLARSSAVIPNFL